MTYLDCLDSPGISCSPDPNIPTTLLSKEDRALFQLCIENACRLTYILSGSLDGHPAQRSALTFSEWFARPDISTAFKFYYSNIAIFDQYADQVRNKVARAVLVTATMESEHVFKHLPINSSNVSLLERAVRESRLAAAKLDSTTKYARPQNHSRATDRGSARSVRSKDRASSPSARNPGASSGPNLKSEMSDMHSASIAPWAHENCRGAQRDGASQHASPRTAAPTHTSVLGADENNAIQSEASSVMSVLATHDRSCIASLDTTPQTRAPLDDWDAAAFLKSMNLSTSSPTKSKSRSKSDSGFNIPLSLSTLLAMPRDSRIAMLNAYCGDASGFPSRSTPHAPPSSEGTPIATAGQTLKSEI